MHANINLNISQLILSKVTYTSAVKSLSMTGSHQDLWHIYLILRVCKLLHSSVCTVVCKPWKYLQLKFFQQHTKTIPDLSQYSIIWDYSWFEFIVLILKFSLPSESTWQRSSNSDSCGVIFSKYLIDERLLYKIHFSRDLHFMDGGEKNHTRRQMGLLCGLQSKVVRWCKINKWCFISVVLLCTCKRF